MKPTIECEDGLLCGTDNCWGTNFVASTDCCFQPGTLRSEKNYKLYFTIISLLNLR